MMSMKSLATAALVTVMGVLAILVTAEIGLRKTGYGYGKEGPRSMHELRLDRPWLYGLRPGARGTDPLLNDTIYLINEDGFRDRRYPKDPPHGVFRIIALGNSIGFGSGVEANETFPKRLEALLNAEGSRPTFEVLNFAVPGYNAYNQEAFLADRGVQYHPDLVLLQFGIGGLHNPTLHFDHQTQMHLGMIPPEAFPDPSQRRPPPRYPALVRACSRFRVCVLLDAILFAPQRRRETPMPKLTSLTEKNLRHGPERSWLRRRYRAIDQTARSVGAKFAVIAFPSRAQVYGKSSGELQRQLAQLGKEENWLIIDLLPLFREAAVGDPGLYLDAWHVSAFAHQIAAEEIARQLSEAGWLPNS